VGAITAAAVASATPVAHAGDGAAHPDADGGAGYGEARAPDQQPTNDRPTTDGDSTKEPEQPTPQPPTDDGGRPVLRSFSVETSRLYLYGRPARVTFRIDDESELVSVALYLTRPGSSAAVRAIDLGSRSTGVTHVYRLTGREGAPLPEGPYRARLFARDPDGKKLLASPRASSLDELSFHRHRFPLRGSFSYGDKEARFGAKRNGHIHQGQDLLAPEGTPIVAPRGGRITKVDFQEGGAGYYVVLDGAGEGDNYVFMHLVEGSIRVREGQRVRTGKRLGDVGTTGASSAPHLHFEIWRGPWYGGGEPIDPLPSLRRWDSWS
jgi:murein DD-endopeptidase MepM/ murein hydrolase activator NlpD